MTELFQAIGGGGGSGALIGGLLAKYFVGKTDKEIEEIKKELQTNKEADSLRDTSIELLKLEMENNKNNTHKIEMQLTKMEEKFEKKLDAIFEKLNR